MWYVASSWTPQFCRFKESSWMPFLRSTPGAIFFSCAKLMILLPQTHAQRGYNVPAVFWVFSEKYVGTPLHDFLPGHILEAETCKVISRPSSVWRIHHGQLTRDDTRKWVPLVSIYLLCHRHSWFLSCFRFRMKNQIFS